jgi:8-oxo-dGTP diphosphatase
MEKLPKVVVGLVVRKDGKILLGKRKTLPLGWGVPGGKVNFGERLEECALRELAEEVGIDVKNLKIVTATNDIHYEMNEHFVTIIMTADYVSGEVVVKEPEKCEKWEWFDWNDIPENLSSCVASLKKQKFEPYEV